MRKYLALLVELKKTRKVVEVSDSDVDRETTRLKNIESHPDFDDAHIVAIVIVSGCKLVCSLDKRSYPFLKARHLYPNTANRPKIYSGVRNKNLLSPKYVAVCCK